MVILCKTKRKKGLYIIYKVIKHKWEKIFRTQLTKTKEDLFNPKLKNKPKIKVKEDFKIKSVDVKYVDVDNNKIKYRNNKELKDVYKNKPNDQHIDYSKNKIIKNYISTQEYRKAHNLTYNNIIDYPSNNERKKMNKWIGQKIIRKKEILCLLKVIKQIKTIIQIIILKENQISIK